YTYINALKKCNQDHEDVCTSEILKSINSEIDCQSLTTNRLYNLLLRDDYFNKLIKFNIDEINEIHVILEKRKNELKDHCKVEFLIDEFSTNDRFENFINNDNNNLDFSINDANLSQDKIEKLQKLRKDKLAKFIYDKIDEFENRIKSSKTLKEIDDLTDKLLNDKILSAKQKEDITTLIQNKLSEINQQPTTLPNTSNIFDELKKEIEDIDKNNADKLLDGGNLNKKIINANISDDNVDELEDLRKKKLFHFRNNEYNEFNDKIDVLKSENELDDMNNAVTNNKILSDTQIKELQDKILQIKENLFPVTPPVNEDLIFNEIKDLIFDVDTDVISEVKTLLDNGIIDQKIKNSGISYSKINELQKLRKDKVDRSKKEFFDNLNKDIDRGYKKEELDNININNEILPDTDKQQIIERIIDEVDVIFGKATTDDILTTGLKHGFIKIQEDKKTEILQKENNEKYDIIKNDIDKFLTPETLDKYVNDEINSLDDKYLTDNRSKRSLNEIQTKKRESLIENFKKEENENYNSLIDDIKNCKDSNLLTDEYYNDIYRNIEDLDEKYLDSANTKSKLHNLRKERKKTLENEII
ncbi:1274_t:CDS:2, partial [Scutellospora calospora]